MESLYTVIVNWNLKDDVVACVSSLLAAGASLKTIIVVDNHSTDASVPALRSSFGEGLTVIEKAENTGYASGLFPGIQLAMQNGADWVLLLNNDIVVDPSFYQELENAIRAHPDYAIFGPLIFDYNHPDCIWFLGDRRIPGLLFTRSLGQSDLSENSSQEVIPVDHISGCAMLVKRRVFETIGFFSDAYFMYAEDIDFCWRAKQAGFKLASVPKAKMWHKVSASSRHDRPLNRYWRIQNQILYYRKYSNPFQVPIHFGLSLLRAMVLIFRDLWSRQPTLIMPTIKGWANGWFSQIVDIHQRSQAS